MREPAQVFSLLETIYAAFDDIATRRRVFKVETIGDCYVSVAGKRCQPHFRQYIIGTTRRLSVLFFFQVFPLLVVITLLPWHALQQTACAS